MMSALWRDVGEKRAKTMVASYQVHCAYHLPYGQIAMCSLEPDRLFPDFRLMFPLLAIRTTPTNNSLCYSLIGTSSRHCHQPCSHWVPFFVFFEAEQNG